MRSSGDPGGTGNGVVLSAGKKSLKTKRLIWENDDAGAWGDAAGLFRAGWIPAGNKNDWLDEQSDAWRPRHEFPENDHSTGRCPGTKRRNISPGKRMSNLFLKRGNKCS